MRFDGARNTEEKFVGEMEGGVSQPVFEYEASVTRSKTHLYIALCNN